VASGVDIVLNRQAGKLREAGALDQAIAAASDRDGARLHESRDLAELDRIARTIAARGTRLVILAGGDGSCMEGLTALARAFGQARLPTVAFAPAGTVCTIARNVGVHGAAGAERLIRAACDGGGRTVRWPTLRVRDDAGGDRIAFIFGAGLVHRFFELYDGSGRGLAEAARIATQVFAGSIVGSSFARRVLDRVSSTVTVDGVTHPNASWSLLVASVLRDVGLHFLVTYRAGEERDRFHLVASGLSPRALGAQAPRVLAGKPLLGEPRIDELARSVRIVFEDPDAAYVLDGDLVRARSVTVQVGPVVSLLVA
jgi:diacylglycerol kinase family enzyme